VQCGGAGSRTRVAHVSRRNNNWLSAAEGVAGVGVAGNRGGWRDSSRPTTVRRRPGGITK